MNILNDLSLSSYSTMQLGGTVAFVIEIQNRSEVAEAIAWADEKQLPVIMIGTGSNLFWRDEGFPGVLLVNRITGIEKQEGAPGEFYLKVGAGMNWDEFVARSVEQGLTGIEFLSLVPGTVGATPVQNVGAYGQEVSNTIVTIEAFDRQAGQLVNLAASDCGFGYRTSRFKTNDRGRFFITAVTYLLHAGNPPAPYYAQIQSYFETHNITNITPAAARQATIEIRQAKLPDPAVNPNNGSFFANPIVDLAKFLDLQAQYPEIVHWQEGDDKQKLSAAWLIEQAGFKDVHDTETGMATWHSQPLVLINENAKHTADLLAFKQKIVDAVNQKFGLTLEQEPEYLPDIS